MRPLYPVDHRGPCQPHILMKPSLFPCSSPFVDCLANHSFFLSFLTLCHAASQTEKLQLSFKIYDADGDDLISTAELTSMLLSTLREHDIVIHNEEIDEIVEATLKEAGAKVPGKIDFEEFQTVVNKTPYVLSHLTLNISSIIADYSEENDVSFKTPRP